MKRLLPLLVLAVLCGCRTKVPRQAPGMPPPIPGHLALRSQDGGGLSLTDGSRWQIQPAGQSASLRWRPGDAIKVIRSGHPAWPFLLTHRPSGAAALARPVPRF